MTPRQPRPLTPAAVLAAPAAPDIEGQAPLWGEPDGRNPQVSATGGILADDPASTTTRRTP
ncbi:hypothetical protein ABT160_43545 [Streptomyces sp. NPDC001941]|uniref:hypothetical protein n=1 Tax=Streptomyces sp. NPDC001941 TaxID=3154659 RepID=UPI0033189EEE